MAEDATFEDGAGAGPLRLMAASAEDLEVLAALVQDAVVQASDMSFMKSQRRFALLLNRFRWEDREAAEAARRPYERVQSLLMIGGVLGVKSQGVDPSDGDLVLSLLGLGFEGGAEGAGHLTATFAGDGALRFDVECLDLTLKDVSRPYVARAQSVPDHPLD